RRGRRLRAPRERAHLRGARRPDRRRGRGERGLLVRGRARAPLPRGHVRPRLEREPDRLRREPARAPPRAERGPPGRRNRPRRDALRLGAERDARRAVAGRPLPAERTRGGAGPGGQRAARGPPRRGGGGRPGVARPPPRARGDALPGRALRAPEARFVAMTAELVVVKGKDRGV